MDSSPNQWVQHVYIFQCVQCDFNVTHADKKSYELPHIQ